MKEFLKEIKRWMKATKTPGQVTKELYEEENKRLIAEIKEQKLEAEKKTNAIVCTKDNGVLVYKDCNDYSFNEDEEVLIIYKDDEVRGFVAINEVVSVSVNCEMNVYPNHYF